MISKFTVKRTDVVRQTSRPPPDLSPAHLRKHNQITAIRETQVEFHQYYMRELTECVVNPTSKTAARLKNIYLKHVHDNFNWFTKIKLLMCSASPTATGLSYRLFNPDDLTSPKVLIKRQISEESPERRYMLLFDLDETLIHCDIKNQGKQTSANGMSVSDYMQKVVLTNIGKRQHPAFRSRDFEEHV